jgi:hypothetical protein
MPRARAPRKGERNPVCWRVVANVGLVCAVSLGWLIVPGCAALNDSRAVPGGDPLFGEKQVDRPPIGPTPPPQNRAGMTVPPAPTTTAAKSITSIIANPPDPLTTTRPPLAIGDASTQTVGGWQPKNDGQTTGAGGPTVQLLTPQAPGIQPVPLPTGNPLQPVPIHLGGGPNDTTQLLATLKDRGMLWNTQQPVAGGVHFSCGIASSPQNPTLVHVYDATAADAAAAMSAVLQKIDQK